VVVVVAETLITEQLVELVVVAEVEIAPVMELLELQIPEVAAAVQHTALAVLVVREDLDSL
jgi:hypothetical protein